MCILKSKNSNAKAQLTGFKIMYVLFLAVSVI